MVLIRRREYDTKGHGKVSMLHLDGSSFSGSGTIVRCYEALGIYLAPWVGKLENQAKRLEAWRQ